MSVKPAELMILRYPAAELRQRARPIAKIDDSIRSIAARMVELMREAKGVGLAAPQVGLPLRMFVTEVPEDGEVKTYINPRLTTAGRERSVSEEGCLSLPGIHVEIERPISAAMTAQDLDGREFTVASDDFAARVWQHEFDHLNGVLILDRISTQERQEQLQKLRESKAVAAMGGKDL